MKDVLIMLVLINVVLASSLVALLFVVCWKTMIVHLLCCMVTFACCCFVGKALKCQAENVS